MGVGDVEVKRDRAGVEEQFGPAQIIVFDADDADAPGPAWVTCRAIAACVSGASKRPIKPMPPRRSIAIAISTPVTVSMLTEISGSRRSMPGAIIVERSTSLRERTRE